ncbi:beta-glucuronidase [Fulvivirga sp. M361]|uniref:glycoside hydrolase family 2 protein n=1 Tax=Fulvivirga sp. M361 TaxID=2594266 RepID=UPI00117ADC58|nr:glycoside hydrolase family 2 TIM barrel-domain containing protein [Fulvivirga sp. M361]TRX61207.1 beta-glucuronidase [Fulvivirga sp. M361]
MDRKTILIFCYTLFTAASVCPGFGQGLLQNLGARDKQCLDGLWQIIIDPLEYGMYTHSYKLKKNGYFLNEKAENSFDRIEYDFDGGYQLYVPGDWNTQMEKLYYYEGTIWYKRSFDALGDTNGRKRLYFEGVNYQCRVYLNGEFLGDHEGGFLPFSFDITNKLKAQDNFIVLKVDNTRQKDGIPTINFDWWNYGGITRSVHIVNLPDTYINDYYLSLVKGTKKKIEGWVKLEGDNVVAQDVMINVPELNIHEKIKTDKNGLASFTLSSEPELWSPDHPKLYEIEIASAEEKLTDHIGFKTIEVRDNDILLNGQTVFLKGISIHEEAPFGVGRVITAEQAATLLTWAKELGCNFIRLAHYPHNEFTVKLAEKMGLMVWSEIPVYWTVNYTNESTYKSAENQLIQMIDRDKNRAGVILWSVANETPVIPERLEFLRKLIQKARAKDQTRLITAALNTQRGEDNNIIIDDPLGEYIDVIGINSYCGWYGKRPAECRDLVWKNTFNKPIIMSEMGGGALAGMHGTKDDRWTEEYQAEVYECNLDMLKKIDFLAGTSPWILMDFRSPRRNLLRIQNDYNRKGLISENGEKKKAFFVLKDFYDHHQSKNKANHSQER